MTDEENAALIIKTGIEQMFAPLHQLLDKLLGPAATEVGLTLGDSVKVWRFKRQLRLLQEVKRLIEDSGRDIKPIATRLFFPVLEAASIEDDDDMQTRWAALLANEAISVGSVHPSYIDILRQLSPDDARLLDKLCDACARKESSVLTAATWRAEDQGSMDNLLRLGLVQTEYDLEPRNRWDERGLVDLDSWYSLTEFAVRFVRACRAPSANAPNLS